MKLFRIITFPSYIAVDRIYHRHLRSNVSWRDDDDRAPARTSTLYDVYLNFTIIPSFFSSWTKGFSHSWWDFGPRWATLNNNRTWAPTRRRRSQRSHESPPRSRGGKVAEFRVWLVNLSSRQGSASQNERMCMCRRRRVSKSVVYIYFIIIYHYIWRTPPHKKLSTISTELMQ